MKSLDTNILVYAANRSCPEHKRAYALVEELLSKPAEWIISDQVLFEYMRALCSRAIFSSPVSKDKAIKAVHDFRTRSGASYCAYDATMFEQVLELHKKTQRDHVFDIVLAVTLKQNGVRQFFTRNIKDFNDLGLPEVINPID